MRETFEETGVKTGNIFSYYIIWFTRRDHLSVKCRVNLNYFYCRGNFMDFILTNLSGKM